MAVPKKRMSRTRKLLRRAQWKLEIRAQALQALSLAAQQKTLLAQGGVQQTEQDGTTPPQSGEGA